MSSEPRYQLRAADGGILVRASDVAALGLAGGATIDERRLRRRLDQLADRSVADAIHALLDQEEPCVVVSVHAWEPRV